MNFQGNTKMIPLRNISSPGKPFCTLFKMIRLCQKSIGASARNFNHVRSQYTCCFSLTAEGLQLLFAFRIGFCGKTSCERIDLRYFKPRVPNILGLFFEARFTLVRFKMRGMIPYFNRVKSKQGGILHCCFKALISKHAGKHTRFHCRSSSLPNTSSKRTILFSLMDS